MKVLNTIYIYKFVKAPETFLLDVCTFLFLFAVEEADERHGL